MKDSDYLNNMQIKMNLCFFNSAEKTEQPTHKKRKEARQKGQVANSQELGTAFLLLSAFFGLRLFAAGIYTSLLEIFNYNYSISSDLSYAFTIPFISRYITFVFARILLLVAPLFLITMATGVIGNLIQVGWHPTTKPLEPKLSGLNPIAGFKKMFSMKLLVDLVKALIKFAVVIFVIYRVVIDDIDAIPLLMQMGTLESFSYIGSIIVNIGLTIGFLFLFIALGDIAYTRYKHTKDLKMTKQEVKEEHKQAEGDPLIKGKIRQKMREMSMRTMMQEVPTADVIITNPTHYAVAVKYDINGTMAPVVVAKGVDFSAKRIKEAGIENSVYIMENKQLARALYASTDVGGEIPSELYQAVAEALAFVYKLKNN
jgi:flagellar biosynthesis protein FlhB